VVKKDLIRKKVFNKGCWGMGKRGKVGTRALEKVAKEILGVSRRLKTREGKRDSGNFCKGLLGRRRKGI